MTNPSHHLKEESLSRIVAAMQSEVDELVQKKVTLVVQLRRLKKTLYALRKTQDGVGGRAKPRRGQRSQRAFRCLEFARGVRCSQNPYGELTRACRIAFAEAGGIATPNEISLSILRRSSFAFDTLDQDPDEAVVCILNFMADAKEARCLSGDQYSRWQFLGSRREGPHSR